MRGVDGCERALRAVGLGIHGVAERCSGELGSGAEGLSQRHSGCGSLPEGAGLWA